MVEIIDRTVDRLGKGATLDEIKSALSAELRKASFDVKSCDYLEMFDAVVLALDEKC